MKRNISLLCAFINICEVMYAIDKRVINNQNDEETEGKEQAEAGVVPSSSLVKLS